MEYSSIIYEFFGVTIMITIKMLNYYIFGNENIMSKNNIIESTSNIILTLLIIKIIKRYYKKYNYKNIHEFHKENEHNILNDKNVLNMKPEERNT